MVELLFCSADRGKPKFDLISSLADSYEPRHDKTNKMSVLPAMTKISLRTRPVWSESSLCAQWVSKDPSFLHADSEDSDPTGRMPRLIWVFAGRTTILLVLSCRSSFTHRQSDRHTLLDAVEFWPDLTIHFRSYSPLRADRHPYLALFRSQPICFYRIKVKIAEQQDRSLDLIF